MPNLSLIGRKIKKLQKNLIFDGTNRLNSVLKLEMRSYSDNAYDVTYFFYCCFEKFLTYTLFLPSFIVVRHQMAEFKLGAPVHYRGFPDPVQNRIKMAQDEFTPLFQVFLYVEVVRQKISQGPHADMSMLVQRRAYQQSKNIFEKLKNYVLMSNL